MLQVIFGDDEHTAVDGPYSRLMKTRKWLYLTSIAAALVSHSYFDTYALNTTLKIVSVSPYFIGTTLVVGLLYLSIQYALLMFQLCSIYDIVLNERFKFRREDELAAARGRVTEADKKVRNITKMVNEHPDIIALNERSRKLDGEEQAVRFDMSAVALSHDYGNHDIDEGDSKSRPLKPFQIAQLKMESIEIERNEISYLLSSTIDKLNRENLFSEAVDDVDVTRLTYNSILKMNPADRNSYRYVESAIDLLRLLPPLVLSVWTLSLLVSALPQLGKTIPTKPIMAGSRPVVRIVPGLPRTKSIAANPKTG